MKQTHVYLDTSAYLCILLGEVYSSKLNRFISKATLYSSTLLFLESTRNLLRLARQGILDQKEYPLLLTRVGEDSQNFTTHNLTLELALDPEMPAVSTPKSLDLGHLKTALWFQKKHPELVFLSLDEKQIRAANELGISVQELR